MKRIILVLSVFIFGLCNNIFSADDDNEFYKQVQAWHERRINSLKSETGWLSLAGLYWLKQGANTFGSARDNDIIFPEDTPKYMGTITLQDSIVTLSVNDSVPVMNDSVRVTQMQLINDNDENPTDLSYDKYTWYIIKRQDKYGIRLKNREHPRLKNFTDIERYPVDIKWRIKARLQKYDPPKDIKVTNVLGQVEELPCPGKLVFEIDGQPYSIDPFPTSNGKRYWIIFGDATNEIETYGGGRYLYIDAVDENGETYIDFNQCYNPPCAFTPYSTCTLPPRQNILPVKVTAGEKSWQGSNH
jgi:uncharacterized protein (DUF1684 family)